MAVKAHPARLYAILARKEPVAVVFRRGPSKQVLLIKWNLNDDTFEYGQWFKGRIYERRCDLSPNGSLLIYFASKQKPPLITWTAISRPPYFTALALWPKGDCWNGGGWFVTDKKIRLNHGPLQTALHSDFGLGPIKVVGLAEFGGEDDTVWDIVRKRDGWGRAESGNAIEQKEWRDGWRCDPPQRWTKTNPKNNDLVLQMEIVGVANREAPWYQIRFNVTESAKTITELGLCDWADWDHHRGELVYARGGCLFRQRYELKRSFAPVSLADFNALRFSDVIAPDSARQWPK
jgi:hypothetical protein